MNAAPWPREDALAERLMVLDGRTNALSHSVIGSLPALLRAGDVAVLNDAATLPASLRGATAAGEAVELRLAGTVDEVRWDAVLFGAGDWRTRTEHRPAPPAVRVGDVLRFGEALQATVRSISDISPRLIGVSFDKRGAALWRALYEAGRPVQYAHVRDELPLWHVQTAFAARPWAVELPSAGRPLRWRVLNALRANGIELATVTHGAGLSATGDDVLDARLPLPERYEVPAETVRAVVSARARGGRVVAVGTSVVRALEGRADAHGGALIPGSGWTDLRIGPATRLRVVDGLLTGMHEPDTSHFELLRAFAPSSLLERAHAHATASGYLGHEFGDSCLILAA